MSAFAHTEQEEANDEGRNYLNQIEADISVSLALARHLVMQGYDPN